MPYIGQSPATGEANSFKTLDNIASYTLTFDGSSASTVSVANDTITERNHRFVTGQRVTYNDGGGTSITGLSDGVYYIIVEDKHTIKLATNANNAAAGTAINLTGLGVGSSHTLNVAFDGVNTKFKATINNGTRADITNAPQLMLSINGVLQQPHNDTTSPTTGYAVDHTSTIIFSAAPAANDQFFASLVASNFATFDISDNIVDNFTGDGSTTDFTLSKAPPNNESVLVTIDGVVQYPDDTGAVRAYTVSENILTFASAPGSAVEIQVRHIGFAGASTGGISGFYGRTGNAVLKNTDNIVFNNATASGTVQAANVTVTGDLTVNGTTTTLDTDLIGVDKLEVNANNTTVAAAITQTGSGDILNLYDGSTEVFSVTDGGKVLIGTQTEGDSSADNLTIADSSNSGITIRSGTSNLGSIFFSDATSGNGEYDGFIQYSQNDRWLKFGTATSTRLTISSGGYIGINEINPTQQLSVHNDTNYQGILINGNAAPRITFARSNSTTVEWGVGIDGTNGDNFAIAQAGNTAKFIIDANGKIGINDNTPDNTLSIKGIGSFDGDSNSFYFGSNFTGTGQNYIGSSKHAQRFFLNNASANGYFSYSNTGSAGTAGDAITWQERFRITSAGNIGVAGATGTDYSLLDGMVINTANGSAGLLINSSSSSHNAFLGFSYGSGSGTSHADQYSAYIGRVGDDTLILGTSNNIRVRVSSGGQVHLTNANSSTTGTSASDLLMANSAAIRFRKGDDSAWINSVGLDSNNNLKLGWGGSTSEIHFGISGIGDQMKLDSGGRLIVGSATSSNAWSGGDDLILGNTTSGTRTGITLVSGSDTDGGLYWSHGTSNDRYAGQIAYNHSNDRMQFYTAASARVTIDNSGRLLIGRVTQLQSSSERLTIDSGMGIIRNNSTSTGALYLRNEDSTADTRHPYLIFTDGSGNRGGIGIQNDASSMWIHGQNGIAFRTSGTSPGSAERLKIHSSGATTMHVNNADHDTFRFTTQGVDEAKLIMRDASDNEDIVLNTGGDSWINSADFGIGTNSPGARLDILNGTSDGTVTRMRNDEVGIVYGVWGTGSSYPREASINGTRFDNGTSPYLRVAGQGGIKFCADLNNERMRIRPTGQVEIHTNGNYGNNLKALNIGSRTSASYQGSLALARGEALGGGTGPYMELVHGPDGGTQRVHAIYSYIGDLRVYADAAENLELSGVETKIKDSSRDDIAIFNSNGLEMEKNTARLFGRYVGRTNTSQNYELTHWTAGSFRILEVFGFINPNAAGSSAYHDPAHFYVYNATGWNGSSISYYLGVKHVAPGARTYAPSGTGSEPAQNIVAKWGNNNSTATTNGSHYLKFEWSGANTSNNYQAYFRVIRRM